MTTILLMRRYTRLGYKKKDVINVEQMGITVIPHYHCGIAMAWSEDMNQGYSSN